MNKTGGIKSGLILLLSLTMVSTSGCSVVHYFVSRRAPSPFPPTTEYGIDVPESTPETVLNREIPAPVEIEKKAEDPNEHLRQEIVRIARTKLGRPYRYGGKGPDSFDCSGFTGWVYRQTGITLSASSGAQYSDGKAIPSGDALKPGDLVFFAGRRDLKTVGHVGIVVDYDRENSSFTFIHAATSTGIELQKSTAAYYALRYLGARRIIEN